MTRLTSLLLLLSLYSQKANCCSSAALASPLLAGAGAIGSIISGFGAARDLNYPVDIYPSSCKRNHWQVCTMTEPNSIREDGRRKWQICRKGNRDCIMRCAPNAMDTETVKQIREFTREANAEFIQHRRTSTMKPARG